MAKRGARSGGAPAVAGAPAAGGRKPGEAPAAQAPAPHGAPGAADRGLDEQALLQFYIPATSSLHERRPRTLKHGDTFGVFDHYGDIVAAAGSPEGLFHRDTRVLSDFQLLIENRRPLLLSSTVQDNNVLLTADLTNPDVFSRGRLRLPKNTIHILRSRYIWQARSHERLRLRNFGDRRHRLKVTLTFKGDFVDLFEVRGKKRPRRGQLSAATDGDRTVRLDYVGLDSVRRGATIAFDPKPTRLDSRQAVFEIELDPGQRQSVFICVACDGDDAPASAAGDFMFSYRHAHRALRAASSRAASVETSNDVFNEILCRSMADLYMLITDTSSGPYPYAGIPWYSTAFGRDGIITAMEMLWIDPEIARGALNFLADRQARALLPDADAEPGKILHETRLGEMALLGEVPFGLYYGSVDSTPLFVMLAGLYFDRTGDLDTIVELWPHIKAALTWLDEYGDADGDGFIEYARKSGSGLLHQGWKDSGDSIFHADGKPADGPIALCEVQGYAYAAKCHAARLARALNFPTDAVILEGQAEALKRRFEEAFWCEEMSFYALALDGRKRPCSVRASNAGHLLFTGIADPGRAGAVADALLGQRFFTGWGIRTVAEGEARYNPMSYHNGSVWPHDNALTALGLARYGLLDHALELLSGLFVAGSYMDLRRLPELFCGFRRVPGKAPTLYPVACSPQAWASAAPFAMLQACLGLAFDLKNRLVRVRRPRLPDFLDEVIVRSLGLGDAKVDLMLRRHGSDVSVNVLRRQGDLHVAVDLG